MSESLDGSYGGSYDGFIANWFKGHSNKFIALVNHDDIFSTNQVYYTTDELYFAEKEVCLCKVYMCI
jgi:dipeptidyl aminopeptidase/acylaminoacyl peptidase